MTNSTTFLKRTTVVVAIAAVAAAVASATTMNGSDERQISQTYALQSGGDALDRYLANRNSASVVPDALERYLANSRRSTPDGLDRFLNNVQRESAAIRSIQRRGGN